MFGVLLFGGLVEGELGELRDVAEDAVDEDAD